MQVVVTLPLFFVGAFLLGQGFPSHRPRRQARIGGAIIATLLLASLLRLGLALIQK